jgi:hypothetical protein
MRYESHFTQPSSLCIGSRDVSSRPRGCEWQCAQAHLPAIVVGRDSWLPVKALVGLELVRVRDGATPGQTFKDRQSRALSGLKEASGHLVGSGSAAQGRNRPGGVGE